jgi:hypothetical protein
MKPMPKFTDREYLSSLTSFDSDLREAVENSRFNADQWIERAKKFDPYWSQVALLFVYHALRKTKQDDIIPSLAHELNHEYLFFLEELKIRH